MYTNTCSHLTMGHIFKNSVIPIRAHSCLTYLNYLLVGSHNNRFYYSLNIHAFNVNLWTSTINTFSSPLFSSQKGRTRFLMQIIRSLLSR